MEEGFVPTICWTNPNIQPLDEHELRLATLLAWARDTAHLEVIIAGDDRDAWEREVAPHGFDRAARCRACYVLRLEEACRCAVERGFTHISTTLAVSPYQLFETCTEELVRLAGEYGLTPVVRDFRPLYPEATRESRELGMYSRLPRRVSSASTRAMPARPPRPTWDRNSSIGEYPLMKNQTGGTLCSPQISTTRCPTS